LSTGSHPHIILGRESSNFTAFKNLPPGAKDSPSPPLLAAALVVVQKSKKLKDI